MDEDDGVLIVDVHKKTDEENGKATVHYINVGMSAGFNNITEDYSNIFYNSETWYRAELDETTGTFTLPNGQGSGTSLSDYLSGYSGEIVVTVYAGTTQSIPVSSYSYASLGKRWTVPTIEPREPIVMDGSQSTETITLRVIQATDSRLGDTGPGVENARIQCSFTYVDPRLHKMAGFQTGYVHPATPTAFDYYEVNRNLAGITVSFTLEDTYGWDFDDIDWANSYFRLNTYSGQQQQNQTGAVRVSGIGVGPVQTVVFPSVEIPNGPTANQAYGRYDNITLFIMRYSCPDQPYQFYVNNAEQTEKRVEIDNTEPGSLEPGLLSFQPYTKFFNYDWSNSQPVIGDGGQYIEMEMSPSAFPRQLIDYDPNDVIFVPAGIGRLDMMFQVLDANGDPAPRLSYYENYIRSFGQYDVVAWNTEDPDNTLTYLQDSSASGNALDGNGYSAEGYSKNYCFRINDAGEIERWTKAGEEGGQLCLSFTMGERNTVHPGTGNRSLQLRLTPDKDNVIAVQTRYVNGGTSNIVYLTIHPVSPAALQGKVSLEPESPDEDALHPWGTVVGASGSIAFRYTPAEGENTAGLSFYLCKGNYGFREERYHERRVMAVRDPVEMIQQSDGSYLAYVPDQEDKLDEFGNLLHYLVAVKDAAGNLSVLPSPENSILIDTQGPRGGDASGRVTDDGQFTASYYIEDVSFSACMTKKGNLKGWPLSAPMTLTFTVDKDYAELIGADHLTVVYDPAVAYAEGNVSYEHNNWTATVDYELPVAENGLGITSIHSTLVLMHAYHTNASGAHVNDGVTSGMNMEASLELTVNGSVSALLATPTDITLTLQAEDCFGNKVWTSVDPSTGEQENKLSAFDAVLRDAVGAEPHFVSAEYRLTGDRRDGWQQDRALYLTFSSAVKPAASWICPEPKGYNTVWADAFPIWKDGEWTISYYDLRDVLHTETITLTNVFQEYGVDLEFSTLDYSTEPIVIQATEEGTGGDCLALVPLPSDGQSFEERHYGVSRASLTADRNGDYVLIRAKYSGSTTEYFTDLSFRRENADYLTIHLDNYVSGRPDETVTLFFADNGREYVAGAPDQRKGTTENTVTLSYRTNRPTQAVGSGETSKTFRPGDSDAFSFTYYDPVTDQEYTLSGSLSAYGITLTQPATTPADEKAPDISLVTVWRQVGARFEQAEAFSGSASDAEIEDVFSAGPYPAPCRTGVAQGFDLVVNAVDASAWRLLLCDTEPTALSYASASAAIPGVTLQGNNVLITKEIGTYAGENFWVAAVDEHGNFTSFLLKKSYFHFDTTAPELVCSEEQISDFYQRIIFLKATDADDAGNNRSEGVTVTGEGVTENDGSNPTFPKADWPWMRVFNENASVPVVVTDSVGNYRQATLTVDGIDSTAPNITVTWAPGAKIWNDVDGVWALNTGSPTSGPVNIDVIANISSDKPIKAVKGLVTVTAPDQSVYEFDPIKSVYSYYPSSVSCKVSAQTVTVTFSDGTAYLDLNGDDYPETAIENARYHVALTITALNGAETDVALDLAAGVVDKAPPTLAEKDFEYLYREKDDGSDYAVPYALRADLKFSEDVYLSGDTLAGKAGVLHRSENRYPCMIYDNDQHLLTMTDKSGNVHTVNLAPATPIPVDNPAPVLSVFNEDELTPVGSQPVTVKVRIDDESGVDEALVNDTNNVTIGSLKQETDSQGVDYYLLPLTVSSNGSYRVTVTDKAGNAAVMRFAVSNLDLTLPTIRFATGTVTIRQNSTDAQLLALLEEGVTLWDNVDTAAVLESRLECHYQGVTLNGEVFPAVNLSVPGVYRVPYTVTDTAGNVGQSIRMVRVLSAAAPEVRVDDKLTELNGTLNLKPGSHVLTVVTPAILNEPYTVKLVKGIWSEGQLKYVTVGVPVEPDGSFNLSGTGFYTLYILTQSRMSYRTLLYAAN